MPRFDPADLATWCGGVWTRWPAAPVTGVCHDTRRLRGGELFVALGGAQTDGHNYVEHAFARGAAAALVSRPPSGGRWPCLVVADTLRALQALAGGYRATLTATLVGVTGSTGKTTVKELIAAMLAAAMPVARTPGNWNNELGLPLSLLAMEPTDRMGVFEVGISHPGEMEPLCAMLGPQWGVVTNVGPVHLEYFGSVSAIAEEKARLLQGLPVDGLAVLAADEEYFPTLRERAGCRVVTVATQGEGADYTLLAPASGRYEWTVVERQSGERRPLRVPLPGAHNRANALLALAVARQAGVEWDRLLTALAGFVALPMRWEQVEHGGVLFINDAYNANPVSMRAALRTFAELAAGGRKWLVLGDMLELGVAGDAEHLRLGREVAAGPWAGLITLGPLAARIAAGAEEAGFPAAAIVRCDAATAAAAALVERLHRGDAVLIKASRGVHAEDVLRLVQRGLTQGG
mgnify:CR=1 FL=1